MSDMAIQVRNEEIQRHFPSRCNDLDRIIEEGHAPATRTTALDERSCSPTSTPQEPSAARLSLLNHPTSHTLSVPRVPQSKNLCPNPKVRKSCLTLPQNWKTISSIVGFLLAGTFHIATLTEANITGIICATCHYQLFTALHSTAVDGGSLSQSQVTALSILLVTLFRASQAASAASSFAQQLWYILRGAPIPIAMIERLFTLRSNLFTLLDPRVIHRASGLFLMALFVWCLGIVTTFPAAALVIKPEAYTESMPMNLSVMNPPPPVGFNPFGSNEMLSYPLLAQVASRPGKRGNSFGAMDYAYFGPSRAVINIAKVVVNNGSFRLPTRLGEDSSYQLAFRGPQFGCNTSEKNITQNMSLSHDGPTFFYNRTTWGLPNVTIEGFRNSQGDSTMTNFTYQHDRVLAFFSDKAWHENEPDSGRVRNVTVELARTEIVCIAYSASYNLTVSYPKGLETLRYTLDDPQPLEWTTRLRFQPGTPDGGSGEWPFANNDIKTYTAAARAYMDDVAAALPRFNQFALIDALFYQFSFLRKPIVDKQSVAGCTHRVGKGSTAYACEWGNRQDYNSQQLVAATENLLKGTIFDPTRFDPFDFRTSSPSSSLAITEGTLNDALVSITLASLTLGLWSRPVLVTSAQTRNVYRFTRPVLLLAPYGSAIVVCALIAAAALYSLRNNGVAAVDGGFAQVMLATRGDSEMERRALKSGGRAADDMSEELKALRVRYGVFLGSSQEGTRMGFGTAEETVSVRRRLKTQCEEQM